MKYTLLSTIALCLLAMANSQIKAPHKVIYMDSSNINWNDPGQTIKDAASYYSTIILDLYLSRYGPYDMALTWSNLPESVKISVVDYVHSKGGIILLGFGGAYDVPYSYDPVTLGAEVGAWAKSQHLDGVDFTLSNLVVGFTGGALNATATVSWIVELNEAARKSFGEQAIITHSPQAPYFGQVGNADSWAGVTGGYSSVNARTKIDWFNVVFYSQGDDCYTSYSGLFTISCFRMKGTSVAQISTYGVPLEKIVVGKTIERNETINGGWVSSNDLHNFFASAQQLGWNAGVAAWQWNTDAPSWIRSVYPYKNYRMNSI